MVEILVSPQNSLQGLRPSLSMAIILEFRANIDDDRVFIPKDIVVDLQGFRGHLVTPACFGMCFSERYCK